MVQMACKKCGIVYDVEYEGEHIWRVAHPDPTMVEARDGFEPINFESASQIQATWFPLCLKIECVLSKTLGHLSDEPIPVDFEIPTPTDL